METIINPHNELMPPANPPSHKASEGQRRNLPRDVFLHLFAIVTLYWSAVSVITLCWQYANYFFPDALNYNYGFSSSMRFALASLLIVFPLFLLTSWILSKIYAKESAVRESKIRKWLIYLTLFITALVIIGDLIFVVNMFLNGEITARFILKASSVLIVAGVIFWYYLDDVRRTGPSKLAQYVAGACIFIVLALVIGAFFIVGSPMEARRLQFDGQRVNDLSNIQWQVVNYWQRKGVLPSKLQDLNDSISGYVAPVDPKTGQPYEYIVENPTMTNFTLCATFDENSTQTDKKTVPYPVGYGDGISQSWDHGAGRVCFNRTIDQELYPPLDKGK